MPVGYKDSMWYAKKQMKRRFSPMQGAAQGPRAIPNSRYFKHCIR